MILNPLTKEYLEFVKINNQAIRGKEYIVNHVLFKKDAVIESMKHGKIGKQDSLIQIDQMQGFVEDLDFIVQVLKGNTNSEFVFLCSQEYQRVIQKEVESIISNIK